MQVLQGIAVSPGVAIGEALVIDTEGFRIPRRFVVRDAVDAELARFQQAVEAVAGEITRNRDAVSARIGQQYGAIFAAHLQMLRDEKLQAEIVALIREQNYSPEYAVSTTLRKFAKVFQELENPYFAERAHDIFDIEKSLLGNLLGRRREELSNLASPVVVLAHNLTPSETATLDRKKVLGFVTEIGGAGGHTAIVAKGLEIPAVVGMGEFLTDVSGGDLVIVDGHQGKVILQPDAETIEQYQREVEARRTFEAGLASLRDLPSVTKDGVKIEIHANIEFPHEVKACLERGADGIGLYRTEFLYLGADTEPTEETHYQAYAEVIGAMEHRPVVIRTLDLGADKMGQMPRAEEEQNPVLGLRSIRLTLRNTPLFRTQLRAILRASQLGDVRLMFPLVTTLHELRRAKMLLADVKEDLEDEGYQFTKPVPVGMMVEVPAAVVMLDRFIREVDFISIGTNDLIQYTLAVDRSNKNVASMYRASEPAVLRLIDQSIQIANRAGISCNLCGQMSSNPEYAMLLIGMGLRSMSVPPAAVPEIKRICRSVTVAQCEQIAQRVRTLDDANAVDKFLRAELHKFSRG